MSSISKPKKPAKPIAVAFYNPGKNRSNVHRAKEVRRINYMLLPKVCLWNHTTNKPLRLDHWGRNILAVVVAPRIRKTDHKIQRLLSYVNSLSRCGTYIEVLPEEAKHLDNIAQWLPRKCREVDALKKPLCRVVELGFNSNREICKIAVTIDISTMSQKPPGSRVLFVCLGMDGGIKTMYVNEGFKHRAYYAGDVEYLDSTDDILQWLF
jgi:hypothetical protein